MNQRILDLARTASAIDAIRQGLIQCGFELEFQRLNGSSSNLDDDDDVDYEGLAEASSEAWGCLSTDDQIDEVKINNETVAELLKALDDLTGQRYDINALPGMISDRDLRNKLIDAIDSAETSWREDWESNNASDYRIQRNVYDSLDVSRSVRNLIDLGSDQSVSGGEIRTIGALSPLTFIKAASELFDKNEFEVDSGCSFHIHLSVPGVTHSYGRSLQANMIAYILDNKNRLPKAVQKRLNSYPLDKYARLQISTEKFTAIHFHERLGTWEFRLFGNVNRSDDARRCLILAIESLRYAYRVKVGLERSLVSQDLMDNFAESASQARKESFRAVARKVRSDSQANGF